MKTCRYKKYIISKKKTGLKIILKSHKMYLGKAHFSTRVLENDFGKFRRVQNRRCAFFALALL